MNASARVTMPASADLEVERTVDLVFLCSENALEPLCHFKYKPLKIIVNPICQRDDLN